jgi:hypothetical protein
MKKDAKNEGYWGGRGAGKSTGVKERVEKEPRLIVFDPIGDYAQERGYNSVKTLKGLYAGIKRNWGKGFRYALTVPRGNDAAAMLNELSEALFIIQKPYYEGKDKRKIVLVVEEMAVSYPEKTLGKNERGFMDLINLGRHYGVSIIGVSQRVAEVKKNFVGNCAEHYFYRMGAAVDYSTVMQLVGREHQQTLKGLQTHEYLHFEQGKVFKGKNKCNFKRR